MPPIDSSTIETRYSTGESQVATMTMRSTKFSTSRKAAFSAAVIIPSPIVKISRIAMPSTKASAAVGEGSQPNSSAPTISTSSCGRKCTSATIMLDQGNSWLGR